MADAAKNVSGWADLLNPKRFTATFFAILTQPVSFFTNYHDWVTKRSPTFIDLHLERHDGDYLGPFKFAVVSIACSKIVFPLLLGLGMLAGAVSQENIWVARTAETGALQEPLAFTGLGPIDALIRAILFYAALYPLGLCFWVFSGQTISVRFATGYFFYVNAWMLLDVLIASVFVIVSFIYPLYGSGFHTIVSIGLYLVYLFMLLGFPVLAWPNIVDLPRPTMALTTGLSFLVWMIFIVVLATVGFDAVQTR